MTYGINGTKKKNNNMNLILCPICTDTFNDLAIVPEDTGFLIDGSVLDFPNIKDYNVNKVGLCHTLFRNGLTKRPYSITLL